MLRNIIEVYNVAVVVDVHHKLHVVCAVYCIHNYFFFFSLIVVCKQCKGQGSCDVPVPGQCVQYYRCQQVENNWYVEKMNCAHGTHFSEATGGCLKPSDANCPYGNPFYLELIRTLIQIWLRIWTKLCICNPSLGRAVELPKIHGTIELKIYDW